MSRAWIALIAVLGVACGDDSTPLPLDSGGMDEDAFVPDSGIDSGLPAVRDGVEGCGAIRFGILGMSLNVHRDADGHLLFYDAAAGPGFLGLYIETPPVRSGTPFDFADAVSDPMAAPIVLLYGWPCANPGDWQTCETLYVATAGRAYVHEVPQVPGDAAFVEFADVFLEPIDRFNPDALTFEWSSRECYYIRGASFSTQAALLANPECGPDDLYCAFADR